MRRLCMALKLILALLASVLVVDLAASIAAASVSRARCKASSFRVQNSTSEGI